MHHRSFIRKKEISRDHPLRKFLFRMTASSFETVGLPDGEVIRYVTDVLVDFVHVDNVYRFRVAPHKACARGRAWRLSDLIDELEEAGRRGLWPESEIQTHIGDSCLFFTGIYPDALGRDRCCLDPWAFVQQGIDAYQWVSEYEAVGAVGQAVSETLQRFRRMCGHPPHRKGIPPRSVLSIPDAPVG